MLKHVVALGLFVATAAHAFAPPTRTVTASGSAAQFTSIGQTTDWAFGVLDSTKPAT